MRKLRPSFALLAALLCSGAAGAAEQSFPLREPPRQNWSFSGIFGTYDKAQLQRGLKVYTETCAACHSLNYVHFRDLQALGYSAAQIKEFAARFRYKTTDAQGSPAQRKGTPQDIFPAPYENAAQAAAANNGAAPPDLSLIARARAVGRPFGFISDLATGYTTQGADYISALLTGYQDPPQNILVPDGQYYNPYFVSGAALSMPPLLSDGLVEYDDGTMQTQAQYADDVAAFLTWAADPHREQREKTGFSVMLFLLVAFALLYALKREIWARPPPNAADAAEKHKTEN